MSPEALAVQTNALTTRPASRALFGAAALAPALVLAAGGLGVWLGMGLLDVALGGLFLGGAHLFVCLRASARAARINLQGDEDALGVGFWVWLLVLGRLGGGVIGMAVAIVLVLLGEASAFGAGVMLVQRGLVEGAGPLAFCAAMTGWCLSLGGRALEWATLRATVVHHDQQTIRARRAMMSAQGGELSMPAEAFAGELSVVHHQQRGGLEVHEVATDEVVFGLEQARDEVTEAQQIAAGRRGR